MWTGTPAERREDDIPTAIQLVNTALVELGEIPIHSFDDGSQEADACRDGFPAWRDAVLELAPWNFCTSYAILTPQADRPAWHWAWQYVLPTDPFCLRVLEIGHGSTLVSIPADIGTMGGRWEAFEICADPTLGRVLMTNENPAKIRYVWRQADLSLWNGLAVQALTKYVAACLAPTVTGQQTRKTALLQEFQAIVDLAMQRDAMEGTPHAVPPNRLLVDVRRRHGGVWPGRMG